jgi:hypothetical protein
MRGHFMKTTERKKQQKNGHFRVFWPLFPTKKPLYLGDDEKLPLPLVVTRLFCKKVTLTLFPAILS